MKIRLCLVFLVGNLWPVLSLNIVMFDVPSHSKIGDSVELSCIYDLKKDKLYSVKVGSNFRTSKFYCSFDFQILPILIFLSLSISASPSRLSFCSSISTSFFLFFLKLPVLQKRRRVLPIRAQRLAARSIPAH